MQPSAPKGVDPKSSYKGAKPAETLPIIPETQQ
jgi:hypothetical protein